MRQGLWTKRRFSGLIVALVVAGLAVAGLAFAATHTYTTGPFPSGGRWSSGCAVGSCAVNYSRMSVTENANVQAEVWGVDVQSGPFLFAWGRAASFVQIGGPGAYSGYIPKCANPSGVLEHGSCTWYD